MRRPLPRLRTQGGHVPANCSPPAPPRTHGRLALLPLTPKWEEVHFLVYIPRCLEASGLCVLPGQSEAACLPSAHRRRSLLVRTSGSPRATLPQATWNLEQPRQRPFWGSRPAQGKGSILSSAVQKGDSQGPKTRPHRKD